MLCNVISCEVEGEKSNEKLIGTVISAQKVGGRKRTGNNNKIAVNLPA